MKFKKNELDIPDFSYYENDELYLEKDIEMMLTQEEEKKIHVTFEMNELEHYKSGDVVGMAHIFLENDEILCSKIYVRRSEVVEKESFFQKILFGDFLF